MVKGLDLFTEFFKDFGNQYILIGGAACDMHFDAAGLRFRATKDLDVILVVKAYSKEFAVRFWQFIENGIYKINEKADGKRTYYRFKQPMNKSFPDQIEFFSVHPEMTAKNENRFTRLPVAEDISGLSAILMDDVYYNYTLRESVRVGYLHLASVHALLCLKVRAFLDLTERLLKGELIDRSSVKKHKNDIIRLTMLTTNEHSHRVPETIAQDIQSALHVFEIDPPDVRSILKEMGAESVPLNIVLAQIMSTFELK